MPSRWSSWTLDSIRIINIWIHLFIYFLLLLLNCKVLLEGGNRATQEAPPSGDKCKHSNPKKNNQKNYKASQEDSQQL